MSSTASTVNSTLTLENWLVAPTNRVAFTRVSEVVPVMPVENDANVVTTLPFESVDTTRLTFSTCDGRNWSVDSYLEETYADGLLILRDGRILYEWYSPDQVASDGHIVFSVTKSIIGTLAGVLAAKGLLDADAPVVRYVPELSQGGYSQATVRHVLDMVVDLDFEESTDDLDSPFGRYRQSTGWHPNAAGRPNIGMRAFLTQIDGSGAGHGRRFHYLSPNSDVLGWICERAAGSDLATLLSELLWKPIGAEAAASITVDRFGAPRAAGGFVGCLRDMARFGECMRLGGKYAGRQIVPENWIHDIQTNANREAWDNGEVSDWIPGGGYRSQWWLTHDETGAYFACGIYGQWIYISPEDRTVIVKQASRPAANEDKKVLQFELDALKQLSRLVASLDRK
jgi:CubicO group peptidase (beta-lactamase class C family)